MSSTLYLKQVKQSVGEIPKILLYFFQCVTGKVFLKSFNFITMPLLTFYITPKEMGIYQLLFAGMGIFTEVATVGFRQYLSVDYFKNPHLSSRLNLVGKNLWVYLRVTSVAFLLMFLVLGWKIEAVYLFISLFAVLQSYLSIFNELYLNVVRFQMKFMRYNAISLLFGGLKVVGILIGVVLLKMQLMGLIFSLLVVEMVQLLYSAYSSKRALMLIRKTQIQQNFSFNSFYQTLKKSIIFVPSTISFWLLMNIDQWMLGSMMGLESVGLYALAGKFPLLFDYMISSSLIMVYTPFLYEKLRIRFVVTGWGNVMLSLAVLISSLFVYYLVNLNIHVLQSIVSSNYYDALDYIPVLVFVACIRLATHLLQLCIQFKGKISFIVCSNILSAAVNVFLNSVWIPKYGIQGCLMATLSSFVLMYFMNLGLHLLLIRYASKERLEHHA